MRTTYLKLADFQQDLDAARQATNTEPTPAQQEAGNYRKGRITVRGYLVAIENPKGSIRSGTSKSGKKWSTTMAHDYGYIVGSKAVDGDAVDLFLGPDPEKGGIYAIDQHLDGKYDETKLMWGFKDEESAREGYLSNYEKGWKGLGHIRKLSEKKLDEWLAGGQTVPAKEAAESPAIYGELGKAFDPLPKENYSGRGIAMVPKTFSGDATAVADRKDREAASGRWGTDAKKMFDSKHPFFLNNVDLPYQSNKNDKAMPFIYDETGQGWRGRMYETAATTPVDSAAMSNDFTRRYSRLEMPGIQWEQSLRNDYDNKNKRINISAEDPRPFSTATHEFEHALGFGDDGWRGLLAPYIGEDVKLRSQPAWLRELQPYAQTAAARQERLALATVETPAVLAETVAEMRGRHAGNRLRAGGPSAAGLPSELQFGVPGYNQVSGEFIRRMGSRHMYGLNPDTNAVVGKPRSMTELLTRPESRQWLQRMGRKVTEKQSNHEKQAVIKQDPDTGKWILRTKDGKRKLGVHATAEAAYKQEYAILKSQEKSASGTPTMARSLAVGTLGSLPGAGLGMLAALGLSKFTGGNINPEVQRLVQSLLAATGGAVGGATARELDGQFDADQWTHSGRKVKRRHHDPLTRALRVAERGAGVPLPELKAAATLGGLLNRCAFYKQASPRWAFQLAKGLLSPKAVKQLSTTAIGSTRRLPGLAPLGAGSEGVAHAAFTPGQGETVVKQFFSNPIGLDLTTRANVMKAHPTLFPKIHAVDQAGGRLVMDRLKPVTDAVSPKDLGSLGGSFSSAGGVNSGGVWQLSGRGIPGAPKRVSVRDVRAANVGHDSKGDLKVLDPIVDYGNPTKWEWQKYNWGNRVKALNPWQKPAPTSPAAPQRPWLDHLNQGGQTRIIRKPHPFAP